MALNTYIDSFVQLMLVAFDANPEPWIHPSGSVMDVLGRTQESFSAFADSRHIEAMLPSSVSLTRKDPPNQLLYLPPIETGGMTQLPAFTWKYDFALSSPQLSLFVALFQLLPSGTLRALALRFETPEESGSADPSGNIETTETSRSDESVHNYWHVQLNTNLTRNRPLSLRGSPADSLCPSWLPDSYPGFPLPAKTPAELLVCLFVSLYGADLKSVPSIRTGVSGPIYQEVRRKMGL